METKKTEQAKERAKSVDGAVKMLSQHVKTIIEAGLLTAEQGKQMHELTQIAIHKHIKNKYGVGN